MNTPIQRAPLPAWRCPDKYVGDIAKILPPIYGSKIVSPQVILTPDNWQADPGLGAILQFETDLGLQGGIEKDGQPVFVYYGTWLQLKANPKIAGYVICEYQGVPLPAGIGGPGQPAGMKWGMSNVAFAEIPPYLEVATPPLPPGPPETDHQMLVDIWHKIVNGQ